MTTEDQVKANKENAQKSTGPRDTDKTRLNALKHGLRAEKCFLPEDMERIEQLQEPLKSEFNPKTSVELFLIRRLAICMWKIDKCVEDAESAKRVDDIEKRIPDEGGIDLSDLVPIDKERPKKIEKEIAKQGIPSYYLPAERDELFNRYETATENQFYKALDKLLELKKNPFREEG